MTELYWSTYSDSDVTTPIKCNPSNTCISPFFYDNILWTTTHSQQTRYNRIISRSKGISQSLWCLHWTPDMLPIYDSMSWNLWYNTSLVLRRFMTFNALLTCMVCQLINVNILLNTPMYYYINTFWTYWHAIKTYFWWIMETVMSKFYRDFKRIADITGDEISSSVKIDALANIKMLIAEIVSLKTDWTNCVFGKWLVDDSSYEWRF